MPFKGLVFFFRVCWWGRAGWRRQAWWFWLGVALLLVVLGPDSAHSVAEYFAGWVIRFIPFAVAAIIIVVFFKNNVLAYVTATLSFMVTSPTSSLFRQPLAFYRWNGLVLFVLVVVCMTWLLQPRTAVVSPDS